MGANLDELERLAALHRSGVLTDDEFAAQKARVLGSATTPAAAMFTRTSETSAVAPPEPSKVWQRRFAFFNEHGSPLSVTGYAALRKLPFWTAMSIRSNWWAFFFGPFYFLFLGVWKRGVSLAVASILLSLVVEKLLGDDFAKAFGFGFNIIYSITANYARYIKVTQGRDEWNPFADVSTSRAQAPGL